MRLEHAFDVPLDIDEAWILLRDVRRIARCMPGASLERVDGDAFSGRIEVKVGPIRMSYVGDAEFSAVDDEARRAVITARAREARGRGTVAATITASLREGDAATSVLLTTDLDITGSPAQFGSGLIADVGDRVLGQFASSLAEDLQGSDGGTSSAVSREPRDGRDGRDKSLNLVATALPAIMARVAPALVTAAVCLLLVLLRRHRRQA